MEAGGAELSRCAALSPVFFKEKLLLHAPPFTEQYDNMTHTLNGTF